MQQDHTAAPPSPHTSAPHTQPARPSATHIRIYTFGSLHIEWVDQQRGCAAAIPEQNLAIKDATSALWLLKLLLSQPQRFALRDEIMEHFWPEVSSTAAAKRLDNVVYALRKLLRPPASAQVLLLRQATPATGNGYQLAAYPHIWVDADAFTWYVEQAARMERFDEESLSWWEAAYELAARGTYLAEERYSQWAMQRRACLEGQHRQCVHRLAALYRQQGHHALAELRLRTYWQTHSTDEDVARPLLELLGEQERYQEAEACYQQMLEALQEEGRDPDARTQDIAAYLRAKQIRRQRVRIAAGTFEHTGIIEQELSLSVAPYMVTKSGVAVPPSLQIAPTQDAATWFGARASNLKMLGTSWHGTDSPMREQQVFIHTEITRWNEMADNDYPTTSEYWLTRRMALATLATVSASLLNKVRFGPLTALVLDEFFAQCGSSIVACWHLLRKDGLATVEYTLPTYLPLLMTLAKQSSPFQRKAAYLASQGCFLMGIIHLHRLRFSERVTSCRQAVEYARVAGDRILLVTALTHLGVAFFDHGQPDRMLHAFQEAASSAARASNTQIDDISPLLQSRIHMGLAGAYARLNRPQETEYQLRLACETFPSSPDDDLLALYADYDLCYLKCIQTYSVAVNTSAHRTRSPVCGPSRARYQATNSVNLAMYRSRMFTAAFSSLSMTNPHFGQR